jgi:short-subunit dehydrogenase
MNLAQKHILLTGATGGLGLALALKLAEKNAVLGIVGRDTIKLSALKAQLAKLGCTAHCILGDLSQQGASQQIISDAKKALGHIDILINNAGVLDFVELQNQSETRITEMVNTNVTALIQSTRALLPDFLNKNKGHFVFVGSIFGSLAFPHYATYCATKFAVHGFSQALRRELVHTNIGVTYVAPRGIDTPMNDAKTAEMFKKTGNVMDSPEKVAGIIVNALENEKEEVFIGGPQSFFAWLNGVCPKLVNLGLKKQTKIALTYLKAPKT